MPRTLHVLAEIMLSRDDPDHRRLRKLVDQGFNFGKTRCASVYNAYQAHPNEWTYTGKLGVSGDRKKRKRLRFRRRQLVDMRSC